MIKKISSVIPGFRTGRLWKRIIACIVYLILLIVIIAILASNSLSVSSFDNTISKWESVALIFFLIIIPFILITNLGNIRNVLPLFKSSSIFKKIVAWTVSFVIIFIGYGLTNSYLSNKHTSDYTALQQQLSEEKAIEKAKETEKKESDKKAKLAEEKAKKETDRQAQLAKEAEDKTKKASDEKTETEASEQIKLAKEKEENTKEEANKQAELAKIKERATKKIIKSFESNLKKDNSKKMLEIYNSSDEQTKIYIEERINEKYFKNAKENKELLLSKKFNKINEFYNQIKFTNEIPNLKNSEIGKVLSKIKGLIETNNALVNFEKEHPRLNYGIVKDISEIQEIDCYVGYRLKSAGTKIGDFTIRDDSYSDMYFISSYTYSQVFGYTPSEDWGAVIQLSANSTLSQAGVYKTKVVSTGTTTLTDRSGFNKEYPKYQEVSQEDIDTYNQVKELIDKQSQLNISIDEFIKIIDEYLS